MSEAEDSRPRPGSGRRPEGLKVRLGAEPPAVYGEPRGTLYGIRSDPCPACGVTLWRQVWSPSSRELWCCTGAGACGSYWGAPRAKAEEGPQGASPGAARRRRKGKAGVAPPEEPDALAGFLGT